MLSSRKCFFLTFVILPLLAFACFRPLSAAARIGYPRTLYKPADIEQARKNISGYDWARETYLRLKESAAYYLPMDRERIRSFIPDRTPLAAIKCPVCGKAPWSYYNLLDEGNVLECVDCKTRWQWDPSDTSETWNIPAVFRYQRMEYMLKGLTAAAIVFQIEGDRRYSAKAAIIVERFAEVFKGYRMNMVHRNQWLDRNDPYYAKIAGWKFREMSIMRGVLLAYDLIHDSGELPPALIQKIDRDLVLYTRDYLLDSYGPGGPASPDSLQDQGYSWWVLAACGVLLDDQETLRLMVESFERILNPANGLFYEDGGFFEGTPSYQNQLMGPISSIPDVIAGNTERDVFSNPRCALLEKCLTWTLDFLYPDGTVPPVNDAHVGDVPQRSFAEIASRRYGNRKAQRFLADHPGKESEEYSEVNWLFRDPEAATQGGEEYSVESVHFPGSGLMALRHAGSGKESQTMAYIDYGAYEPPNKPPYHKHQDYLNFGLWACGREMVSEMGYAMTPPWVQKWQVSPMAHNTVIESTRQKEGGKCLIWHITPFAKMAEAGLPPENSRFIALLPRASGEPIVVDIFRVSGELPEFTWAMHARSGDLQVRGVDLTTDAEVEPPLRKGKQGKPTAGTIRALWRFPDGKGLSVLIPVMEGCTVVASECPPEEEEIAAAHLKGGTLKPGAIIPYRGHIQVRRTGPDAVFTAVHVPFSGDMEPQPNVTCERLARGGLALRIDFTDESFIVLHIPQPGKAEYSGLALDGRAGVAILRGGKLMALSLAEGRSLTFEKTGIFRSTIGNGFRTADTR